MGKRESRGQKWLGRVDERKVSEVHCRRSEPLFNGDRPGRPPLESFTIYHKYPGPIPTSTPYGTSQVRPSNKYENVEVVSRRDR